MVHVAVSDIVSLSSSASFFALHHDFPLIDSHRMKALLFTLIRSFEFSMVFAPESFQKRSFVVTRPYLRGEEKKGAQMPLMVKLCEA